MARKRPVEPPLPVTRQLITKRPDFLVAAALLQDVRDVEHLLCSLMNPQESDTIQRASDLLVAAESLLKSVKACVYESES